MRIKFLLLITIYVFTAASPVLATVLTFDDIQGTMVPIPSGYGGLNWSQYFYQLNGGDSDWAGAGYDHGRVSDNHVAYNSFENVVTTYGGKFDFTGAYLTGAWNDGLNVEVKGYYNSNLLYDQIVIVNTAGPTWFLANYLGIDTLEFSPFGGTPHPNLVGEGHHFAMDNFTFNESATVPEPFTMLLLGSGLIRLWWLRKKFEK